MATEGSVACQLLREEMLTNSSQSENELRDEDSVEESEKYDDRTGDEELQDEPKGVGEKREYDDSSAWSKSKKRRKQSNPIRYHSVFPLNLTTEKPLIEDDSLSEHSTDDAKVKCPHCEESFDSEEPLRDHIEMEHVQKLLEKQLHQQQQMTFKSSPESSNGPPILEKIKDLESEGEEKPDSPHKDEPLTPTSISTSYGMSIASQAAAFAAAMSNSVSTTSSMPYPQIPGLIPSMPQNGGTVDLQQPMNLSMSMGAFPGHVPPYLIPLFPQGHSPPVTSCPTSSTTPSSHTPSGVRIFNPEAYCELCNKEFCNKYFLKTHKANKHGIYSMDSFVNLPYGNALFAASLAANTIPAQLRPMLGTSPPTSIDSPMVKSSGIINMESYCEICQKEFCNKYFLKKHKLKIHGITCSSMASSPITATTALTSSSPLSMSESKPTTTVPIKTEFSLVSCGIDTPLVSSMVESPIKIPKLDSPNDVVAEKKEQEISLPVSQALDGSRTIDIPVSQALDGSKTIDIPGVIATTNTTTTAANANAIMTNVVKSTEESRSSIVFTPEKLREIGVINADAFCELCCKEFCNKYFLRTHRQNKHGLRTTESPPCTNNSPNMVNVSAKMTVPTGRMSISSNTSENGERPISQANSRTSISPPVLTIAVPPELGQKYEASESKELSCHYCSRPFASPYLLKMHLFYTHNVPNQTGDPDNESPRSDSPSAKPPSIDDRKTPIDAHMEDASQDLHKLQSLIQELNGPAHNSDSKVQCHMCFQEMENKYFLRAHMMTEHGTLLSEESLNNYSMAGEEAFKRHLMIVNDDGAAEKKFPVEAEVKCDICLKDFCNKFFLKQHRITAHGLTESMEMIDGVVDGSKQDAVDKQPEINAKDLATDSPNKQQINGQSTGSGRRNYCEICNKELCNKYFMKTHMLKMHGISVNERSMTANGLEGAGRSSIGGVTCDICQKELCSKYFLKVHKQNTHGVYEEGGPVTPTPNKENPPPFSVSPPVLPPQSISPPTSLSMAMDNGRYFSHYSEICPLCDRRFKSIKWLKTHMANDHKDLLKENMFLSNFASMSPGVDPQSFDMAARSVANVAALFHSPLMNGGPPGMVDNSEMIAKVLSAQKNMFSSSVDSNMEGSPETSPVEPPSPSSDNDPPPLEEGFQKETIMGNGTRIYHCSYCVYSTRWLSNLYAHEKRHTGGLVAETEHKFICRICHRAYRYNHSLQRHMLSHKILGGLARSSNSLESLDKSAEDSSVDGSKVKPKKYRCSRCSKKFHSRELCVMHIRSFHGTKSSKDSAEAGNGNCTDPPSDKESADKQTYNCLKCNYSTNNFLLLNQHIKQGHKQLNNTNLNSDGEDDGGERSPLNNDMPMTYAMPQNMPAAGQFIMQPFLIAQPENEKSQDEEKVKVEQQEDEEDCSDQSKPFVPSLVYLPVSQKISKPLTVAFTLTPA